MRTLITTLLFCSSLMACANVVSAESGQTRIVRATYRLENPKTSGTGFVVSVSPERRLLVTAAHTFEQMSGERATITLRKRDDNGDWSPLVSEIAIRKGEESLWAKHPQQDVAALLLPDGFPVEAIPVTMLANADDWKDHAPGPGEFVRIAGFPHAAQFRPSPAGFPLTRLGCVASYPVTPLEKYPTFLLDYNSFEGDSGGPVSFEASGKDKSQVKIIGLIHAQHFIDDRYKTVYQSGMLRKRLGLAIVINSQAILETIAPTSRDKSD